MYAWLKHEKGIGTVCGPAGNSASEGVSRGIISRNSVEVTEFGTGGATYEALHTEPSRQEGPSPQLTEPLYVPKGALLSATQEEEEEDWCRLAVEEAGSQGSEDLDNPWGETSTIDSILDWTKRFFPEMDVQESTVKELISEVYSIGSWVFGAEKAREWAGDFVIPRESVDKDVAELKECNNDFRLLVSRRKALLRPLRLNEQRVLACISSDNPDRDRLLLLARGMPLLESEDYRGCTWEGRPALGRTFLDAAGAVEKMFYRDFWSEGLAIILTEKEVSVMPKLGLCLAGWAKKLGKECGRPITNGSGRRSMIQEEYLNSPYTKAMANEVFGTIQHPVIGDIPRMIFEFETTYGYSTKDIRIWKFDLRKAFTLLTYAIEAVENLGIELSDGNIMFFLAGVFGLTGMPMAFQVVTRAIVYEVSRLIHGRLKMYVDDGFGVAHVASLAHDQQAAFLFIEALLGQNAIETSKTEEGPVLDFIGYEVNLPGRYVSVSRRNLLKTLFAFQDIDLTPGAVIKVKKMQGLASLGSRYGYISHLMRPYVRVLYLSFRGKSHSGFTTLTNAARRVIRLFKSLFMLMAIRGETFSRPFASFIRRPHTWVCEYDASLSGVGIIWFRILPDGTELAVAYTSVDIRFLGFGTDSSFQNTAEYIGGLLCAYGMTVMGVGSEPTLHRGDSISALTWTQKGTARSDVAIKAALMWAVSVMTQLTDVTGIHHFSHDENSNADILSRNGSWEEVVRNDKSGRRSLPRELPRLDLQCTDLLMLCDPREPIDTDEEFCAFFRQALQFHSA